MSRQFLSFLFVGGLGFLTDGCILKLMIDWIGLSPYVSRMFSFILAVFVTWQLNSRMTFKNNDCGKLKFLKYFAANSVGAFVNLGIYMSAIAVFDISPFISLTLASALALSINYLLNCRLVFNG